MNEIIINKKTQRQLKKVPSHINNNFQTWAEQVELYGIIEVNKHDYR